MENETTRLSRRCGARREGDENVCPSCPLRWDVNEAKPSCPIRADDTPNTPV